MENRLTGKIVDIKDTEEYKTFIKDNRVGMFGVFKVGDFEELFLIHTDEDIEMTEDMIKKMFTDLGIQMAVRWRNSEISRRNIPTKYPDRNPDEMSGKEKAAIRRSNGNR